MVKISTYNWPFTSVDSQPQIKNSTGIYLSRKKSLQLSGPAKFKPMLFKGQLCFTML